MTTTTATALVEYKFIENTEATQVTATSKTIIDAVAVTNSSAAAATFNLSLVVNGGSAGNVNRAIKDKLLRAGETYLCPDVIGQVLETGDFISAISTVASALNIRASGRVIT